MRCAICNRPLLRAALSITTRGGVLAIGPNCAAKQGLSVRRKRKPRRVEVERCRATVDWVSEVRA